MVPIWYDEAFLGHQTGAGHPECPARLTAIVSALKQGAQADRLRWLAPTAIEVRSPLSWVEAVHSQHYLKALKDLCQAGGGFLDGDTPVSSESYAVALLAVNAWLDGVDEVVRSQSPGFVLARPPGHHALADGGMGFCLLGNAAIAARYALTIGCERVAILDWDVHHGNGTQALVEAQAQISYCSLHEFPHYPGTGRSSERGMHGNVLNIPMRAGSDGADYDRAFLELVMPFLRSVSPDLVIVSAGYDAAAADPLANVNLMPQDYDRMTEQLLTITSSVLFGLEGGYDLRAIGESVVATIAACVRCLERS